jgi:Protein of unknown function (DUF4031)
VTYYCDNRRHLVCWPYTRANLHAMARTLGIKACWFHGGDRPHYDIPLTRIAEISARCVVVRPRTILAITQGQDPNDLR